MLAIGLACALAGAPVDMGALQRAADEAVAEERWCDGLHWYLELESVAHDPKRLFNAAELARAAGDRGRALALYQQLIDNEPHFSELAAAKVATAELQKEIGARGAGTVCRVPAPACGNGVVESGEQCDDGNLDDTDACSSKCQRNARCGDGIVDPGEECDDGNNADGDECTAQCSLPRSRPLLTIPTKPLVPLAASWSLVGGGVLFVAAGAVVTALGAGEAQQASNDATEYNAVALRATKANDARDLVLKTNAAASARNNLVSASGVYDDVGKYEIPAGIALVSVGAAIALAGVVTFFLVKEDAP